MRRKVWPMLLTAVFLATAPVAAPPRAAAGDAPPALRFRWSFCAQVGPPEQTRIVPITGDTALRTGDRIKFFWQPVTACHLYLLHLSSQGKLRLLFPADPAADPAPANREHFIPEGHGWFQLDAHTGTEVFYLLASRERLAGLEDLIARHLQAPGGGAGPSVEPILAEMKRLRRENLQLAAPAERPVRLGGNLRGPGDPSGAQDIRPFAVEISAPGFFSRTFTLDHQ